MLAERPLPADIDRRLALLGEAWASEADVAATFLFGSRARGTAAARADVDLAVALRREMSPGARWRKRLVLLDDACRRLGTDAVDLVVLEDAPAVLGHRAVRDGRLLSESDVRRRVEVVEAVLRRYLDEAPLRAELDRALGERVREERYAR